MSAVLTPHVLRERFALITILLLCTVTMTASIYKCWELNTGFHSNGKCFILEHNVKDWEHANKYCQRIYSRMAEPRTYDSMTKLIAYDYSSTAWLGMKAIPKRVYFVTDKKEFQYPLLIDPYDPKCDRTPICCICRFANIGYLRDQICVRQNKFFCEKDLPERYIIVIPPLGGAQNGEPTVHTAMLTFVAKTNFLTVTVNIRYVTPFLTTQLQQLILNTDDDKPVQKYFLEVNKTAAYGGGPVSVIEVTTTNPVTLIYTVTDDTLTEHFLVPLLNELLDISFNYVLVSPMRQRTVVETQVVALTNGSTEVEMDFLNVKSQHILCGQSGVSNREACRVSLTNLQSVTIEGEVDLEGLHVRASQEVAVFAILSETNAQISSPQYQVMPDDIASSEYVTFPLFDTEDFTQTDYYKIISIHPGTNISFNGEYRYHSSARQVDVIEIPVNGYFFIKGNNPFKMYKITNQARNDSCWSPLVPRQLWRNEYRIWNYDESNEIFVHLIMEKGFENSLKINGFVTPLICGSVSGSDDLIACSFDVMSLLSLTTNVLHINLPTPFGAYAVWKNDDELFCRRLGVKLVDIQLEQLSHTTTTVNSTLPDSTETTSQSSLNMTSALSTLNMTSTQSTLNVTSTQSTLNMTSTQSTLNMTSTQSTLNMTSTQSTLNMTSTQSTLNMTSTKSQFNATSTLSTVNATSFSAATSSVTTKNTTLTSEMDFNSSSTPTATTTTTSTMVSALPTSPEAETTRVAATTSTTTSENNTLPGTYELTSFNLSTVATSPQTVEENKGNTTTSSLDNTTSCFRAKTLPTNLTLDEVQNLLNEIKKKLVVDTKNTSSYIRKKTSAKDIRTSSQTLGYVGVVFISVLLSFVVLLDIITNYESFHRTLRALKRMCR